MRVNSELHCEATAHDLRDVAYLIGETSAIGIAKHHDVRASLFRGQIGGQRIFGISLIAVEAVLCVVNHVFAVIFQIADRIGNHRQVFIRSSPKNLFYVQGRSFAEDGHDGRFGFKQQPHLVVLLDRHTLGPTARPRCVHHVRDGVVACAGVDGKNPVVVPAGVEVYVRSTVPAKPPVPGRPVS